MSASPASPRPAPTRRALIAAAAYAGLLLVFLALIVSTAVDLLERRAEMTAAAERLARLQERRLHPLGAAAEGELGRSGSPFLEGPSRTVAGATLLQRLSQAVAQGHGRLTSTRVELTDEALGADFIGVEASLDIRQSDLQGLLYDLEANLPFLFISRFTARAKTERTTTSGRQQVGDEEAGDEDERHLEVTLTVYGRWRGAS